MGKFKAQIKCKGSGRKSKGKIPPGFYSIGGEESLKHLGVVEQWEVVVGMDFFKEDHTEDFS